MATAAFPNSGMNTSLDPAWVDYDVVGIGATGSLEKNPAALTQGATKPWRWLAHRSQRSDERAVLSSV
jgi:hypothetical protein